MKKLLACLILGLVLITGVFADYTIVIGGVTGNFALRIAKTVKTKEDV